VFGLRHEEVLDRNIEMKSQVTETKNKLF